MTTSPSTPPTDEQWRTSEHVARIALTLVADHPGEIGSLRCARIIGGFTVPYTGDEQQQLFVQYAIPDLGWTLRTLKALIDALEHGGLIARSVGPRPTLALTRAGHRALHALELDGDAS